MEIESIEESVIGFEALYSSMEKCRKGVIWKDSVAHYVLNAIEETLKLENGLKDGTYKERKPVTFTVTSPKVREIVSISFRDRIYQRSLNDNAIYPQMCKQFIYDNMACQTGKGTDAARERLKHFLRKIYRKHKLGCYVLQCDIKGYYPNMPHDVAKDKFRRGLDAWTYQKTERVLEKQYEGETGFNAGSQLIQIAGISVLDDLDHYIKERLRVKYYIRYMDDFILMHESKEFLQECKEKIAEHVASNGFELHPRKTRIYPVGDGILFLGFTFRLTPTGKIVVTINLDNVKRERKKLRRLVNKAKKGLITKEKVDFCYAGWRNHAAKGNSYKLLQRMDAYYKELWR